MMHVIDAYSVDDALVKGLKLLKEQGKKDTSRAGDVWVAPFPVTTVYHRTLRRVLFNSVRDANPFFHLMEALWLLAGRNDAKWLDQFVSDFSARFAQPDGTIHGSYGFRWRHYFDMEGGGSPHLPDQLDTVVRLLRENPRDRQAVITMWDPVADLGVQGLKDRPCNTHIYLRVREDTKAFGALEHGLKYDSVVGTYRYLDVTVCCRSNDIIWGAYGANAVHFSVLQEYLAKCIGVGVGLLYQVSNNWHGYEATLNDKIFEGGGGSRYEDYMVLTTPIVTSPETFNTDLGKFMVDPAHCVCVNPFFENIASPIYRANLAWKNKERELALRELSLMPTRCDWRVAAEEWCARRMAPKGE